MEVPLQLLLSEWQTEAGGHPAIDGPHSVAPCHLWVARI